MLRFVCLLVCVANAFGDVGIGKNQYLPPDRGYSYDKPNLPFPSGQNPTQVPFPRPPAQPQQPRPPAPPRPYQPPAEDHHHHEPGMPFEFSYAVNDVPTQNDYSHKAVSDGDVTRGEYRVAMPDGRVQVVRYTADWKNGYNAEVTYEGTPTYPSGPYGQASNDQGYRY
ncbi:pro-resilin [Lutzomyia longipalpis]|uniref:pro-resilin n=1 Tax=Lutzomyia longipalpis TaxID=7200 RepID=UPI002483AB26|nr:pro-resilin [Lutzomyia longipalpis]